MCTYIDIWDFEAFDDSSGDNERLALLEQSTACLANIAPTSWTLRNKPNAESWPMVHMPCALTLLLNQIWVPDESCPNCSWFMSTLAMQVRTTMGLQ